MLLCSGYTPLLNLSFTTKLSNCPLSLLAVNPTFPWFSGKEITNFQFIEALVVDFSATSWDLTESASIEEISSGLQACSLKKKYSQSKCSKHVKTKKNCSLRDLHDSSYHTKAEFNNCSIIHLKYFLTVLPLRRLSSEHSPVSYTISYINSFFSCRYFLKVDVIHPAVFFLRVLAFAPFSFGHQFGYFTFG